VNGTQSQFSNIFSTASTIWRSRGVITKVGDPAERVATQFITALSDQYKGEKVASDFTPPTKTAKAPASKGVINKIMMLHFAPGSDNLLPGSDYVLDSLGETLTTFGNTSIQIEGHTDSTGSANINRSLSQKRAAAVEHYLEEHFQTDARRFRTYGFGSDRPLASNSTQEGQAANRRTEIRVLLNQ
jgi:outer membrane protein OmpA-like peptidoglycan-associated protein